MTQPQKPIVTAYNKFKDNYIAITALLTLCFFMVCLAFSYSYLNALDIDLFTFLGLSEIYLIPLSKGVIIQIILMLVLPTMLAIFFFPIFQTLKLTVETYKEEESNKNKLIRSIEKIFEVLTSFKKELSGLAIILTVLWFAFASVRGPEVEANKLKDGYAARYAITLSGNSLMECVGIAGGSSNVLFIWDYNNESSLVISKSSIIKIEQTIPDTPVKKTYKNPLDSPKEHQAKVEHSVTQIKSWHILLKEECKQKINDRPDKQQ